MIRISCVLSGCPCYRPSGRRRVCSAELWRSEFETNAYFEGVLQQRLDVMMRLQTEPCRNLCYIEQIIQLYLCLPQLPTQLQTPLNLPLIPYLKILNSLLIELHPEIGHAQLPIGHAILLHFLKLANAYISLEPPLQGILEVLQSLGVFLEAPVTDSEVVEGCEGVLFVR